MRQQPICLVTGLAVLLCGGIGPASSAVPSDQWDVEVQLSNGVAGAEVLTIGQRANATDGLDLELGEQPLPPPPPTVVFDARLVVPSGEATRADFRPHSVDDVFYKVIWQPGDGGGALTLSWDAARLPAGDVELIDELGGVYFGPVDMRSTESFELPSELYFVRSAVVRVSGGTVENTPPQINSLPEIKAYAGQRLPPVRLAEYAEDVEDSISALVWSIEASENIVASVESGSQTLWVSVPDGWVGTDSVTLRVEDTGGLYDIRTANVVVSGPVRHPRWELPLQLRAGGLEALDLVVGLSPEAADGQDSREDELPPPPPTDVFDARLVLPTGHHSLRDIRHSPRDSVRFTGRIQVPPGVSSVVLNWDEHSEPPGQILLRSLLGGVSDTALSEVPENQVGFSTLPGQIIDLSICGFALTDTVPPSIPANVSVSGTPGSNHLRVKWSPVEDQSFDYYDLQFFDSSGIEFYRADRWSHPELNGIEQAHADLQITAPAEKFTVRLSAWDSFGNRSTADIVTSAGPPLPTPRQFPQITAAYPNPFNPILRLEMKLPIGPYAVQVFDSKGRLLDEISRGNVTAPGSYELTWRPGGSLLGRPASQVLIISVRGLHGRNSRQVTLLK